MRLTCPKCDAQYEVPDEVIPSSGRDVQCSSCGETWFQARAEAAPGAVSANVASRPVIETSETGMDDSAAPAVPHTAPDREEPRPAAPREIDPAVADILREEARHEAELRASEGGQGLESQPDLGLSGVAGATVAREADEFDTRQELGSEAATKPPAGTGTRSDTLPDIEEINSSLRGSGDVAVAQDAGDGGTERSGGFTRGFALVMLITALLVLAYVNAPKLAQSVPAAEPALASYVDLVNQGRIWLEVQASGLIPN